MTAEDSALLAELAELDRRTADIRRQIGGEIERLDRDIEDLTAVAAAVEAFETGALMADDPVDRGVSLTPRQATLFRAELRRRIPYATRDRRAPACQGIARAGASRSRERRARCSRGGTRAGPSGDDVPGEDEPGDAGRDGGGPRGWSR